MKVLVTGASGMFGRAVRAELIARGYEVVGLCHSRPAPGLVACDLTSAEAVEQLFAQPTFAAVVHLAALRKPDDCDSRPQATRSLNIDATERLAQAAARQGRYFIYISSDYVFDGTEPPYSAAATPRPANFYGSTKLAGEQAVQSAYAAAPGACAILRVPVLYTLTPCDWEESSVTSVIGKVLTAGGTEPLVLDSWAVRYPTLVEDLACVIADMVERQVAGICQWSSNEPFTKYEMGRIIARLAGLPSGNLQPSGAPANGTSPRPKDCHLLRDKLAGLGVKSPDTPFEAAIRQILAR